MDKTLEIVMVAVALVVAVVIVTGILQGRAGTFGTFADNQTSSSGCSIDTSKLSRYCNGDSGGSCSGWDEGAAQNICQSSSCGQTLSPNNVC